MFHVDGQQIAVFSIVALAAVSLGRRAADQVNAFRASNSSKSVCGGCGGCGGAPAKTAEPKLVQIQLQAPNRIRRSEVE